MKSVGTSLLDQSTLKTVVKNGVAEEDRSRNLMIFLHLAWKKMLTSRSVKRCVKF